MRILFVGQVRDGQTAKMRMEALAEMGHDVRGVDSTLASGVGRLAGLARGRSRARFAAVLNESVVRSILAHRPRLLWADKQELLLPDTIDFAQRRGAEVLYYTPDPYFTLAARRTPLTEACMPRYDHVVTSKSYETEDYRRVCRHVIYSPLGYSPRDHRPLAPAQAQLLPRYASAIVFVGTWEPRREALLTSIARRRIQVKVWGYAWRDAIRAGTGPIKMRRLSKLSGQPRLAVRGNPLLGRSVMGGEVLGDEYACILTAASIGLGFLRRICPDQHTTRTFEIPACSSMLLADRTPEHESFFTEGKEAEYFDSAEELLTKAEFYLRNPEARQRIAAGGYRRCLASRYSYRDRIEDVLAAIS